MCKQCGGSCYCHMGNAPCGYCDAHIECDICGEIVLRDVAETFTDKSDGSCITVCPSCAKDEVE